MELKICENCKKSININEKECPHCKYIDNKIITEEIKEKNIESNNIQPTTNNESKVSNLTECPKCGVKLLNEENICENCGTDLNNIYNNEVIQNNQIKNKYKKEKENNINWLIYILSSITSLVLIILMIGTDFYDWEIGYYKLDEIQINNVFILTFLISTISIITLKIKNPKKVLVTVLFIMNTIISIILIILISFFIVIRMVCEGCIDSIVEPAIDETMENEEVQETCAGIGSLG